MKIAFWSPMHGTGATANMLAVALAVACRKDRSILLTQTHYSMNNLEQPLLGRTTGEEDADYFRDTGIDAVVRYFKAGILSEEILNNCAIDVAPGLSLLAGTRQSSRETYETDVLRSIVGHILGKAQEYYDWVVVDTNSGYSMSSFETVLGADIIVVNLRQSKRMLDDFFANEAYEKLKSRKLFYLFGSYDPKSKYNLRNLRHMYKDITAANSGGMPHCTEYMDALCDNNAFRYITTNIVADSDYSDISFFAGLREITDKLIKMASECRPENRETESKQEGA